jgi:hypothetical protein
MRLYASLKNVFRVSCQMVDPVFYATAVACVQLFPILAGPIYNNCTLCVKNCKNPGGPPVYSLEWAQQSYDGKSVGVELVDGRGFILWAATSLDEILQSKTYQDNVGNYHHKWAWRVQVLS